MSEKNNDLQIFDQAILADILGHINQHEGSVDSDLRRQHTYLAL